MISMLCFVLLLREYIFTSTSHYFTLQMLPLYHKYRCKRCVHSGKRGIKQTLLNYTHPKKLEYPWWNNSSSMESLKLLPSLLTVQFSFTIMGYAICQCCCTGIKRQVIFDSWFCWLTSATQWGTAPQQSMWSGMWLLDIEHEVEKVYVDMSSVLGEWHHPVQGTGRPIWVLLRLQEPEQDEGEFFHNKQLPEDRSLAESRNNEDI